MKTKLFSVFLISLSSFVGGCLSDDWCCRCDKFDELDAHDDETAELQKESHEMTKQEKDEITFLVKFRQMIKQKDWDALQKISVLPASISVEEYNQKHEKHFFEVLLGQQVLNNPDVIKLARLKNELSGRQALQYYYFPLSDHLAKTIIGVCENDKSGSWYFKWDNDLVKFNFPIELAK